jgi:hypothetical protein
MKEMKKNQNIRLKTAYQKITSEGRDVLDRMLGQLAEVHKANADLFFKSDASRKRFKKQK